MGDTRRDATLVDANNVLVAADDLRLGFDFFELRRRENDETDFAYPTLSYTISGSDLVPPEA